MKLRTTLLMGAILGLTGCFVVTPGHRDDVLGGGQSDGGQSDGGDSAVAPPVDAGNSVLVDVCGDSTADYLVLRDSMPPFIVDTTGLVNRVSSCGSASAPGNDGFLAIEVTAGDQWHFHVIPDPATAGQVRDPFLYLVLPSGSSCDTRACQHFSNSCEGTGDEHFAFIAPEDGIWYLGIDDAMAGGGVYQIEAVRLQCGDGDKVHGEACDETSATCNNSCQQILSDTRPNEVEANDNAIEANFVEIPAINNVTLSGTIGGDSCTYPDVYNFRVPIEGSAVSIDILNTDDSVCDNGSLTPFDIVLRNSAGEVRAGPTTNSTTGCAELRVAGLSAAAYFLHLEHATPIRDRVVPYKVRITVTPP